MAKSRSGHRQRLRDRFASGEDCTRSEEALLELLLTYAIPQRDIQPLARRLLDEFGSLTAVLEAPVDTLCDLDGIGESSAVLLKLVHWIGQHRGGKPPTRVTPMPATQATLFEVSPVEDKERGTPSRRKPTRPKVAARRGTEMFANAVLKETIALLPGVPETESVEEMRSYLRDSLHYSAEQTRQRYASYITRRMFPNDQVDAPMLVFARAFPNTQELRDVCFYRFLRAEPLQVRVVEDLLLPNLGSGRLGRDRIRDYLAEKFPDSKSIKDCGQAVVDALRAAGIANADRTRVSFALRDVSLRSFAFVLHSEFPEPGMYDIGKLEENRLLRAMLWNPERLLPSLYELRNRGFISKISEIDNIRQFTTRHTLAGVVEQIVPDRE